MKQALAMILAGGKGKRMDILCQVRPKPALPFVGRLRVIDFSLSNCVHSKIQNIAMLTDYQRSQMVKYLRSWHLNNPGHNEVDVLEPRDGSYKGTADAVHQNMDYLRKADADAVLILAGDHVYKMDYRQMLAFHERVKADVTIGVVQVLTKEAHRFGIVTVESEGKVINFVEKPTFPQSNLVSMGIYVFDKRILCERLTEDADQPDSPHDFGYAIIPGMVRRDRVFAYKFNDYWRDIGTTAAFHEANMEIMNHQRRFSLDGSWPILTGGNDPQPREELVTGTIVNSIISPGCFVRGRVENSILSPGVCIDSEAEVRNSVLMSNVCVGYHSVVDSCILDEQVNISDFCYIGFGSGFLSVDGDLTVIGKGAIVPPYTAIGHGCHVLPYKGPSDFSTPVVPSGSMVRRQYLHGNTSDLEKIGANER